MCATLISTHRSDFEGLLTQSSCFADLASLTRIILASPDTFHHLVATTASRTGASPDAILDTIVTQYVDRVSSFADPDVSQRD